MKKIYIALTLVLLFTGCADVVDVDPCLVTGDPYGFWGGLWHGATVPFSWIGSLFSDNIALYAVENNGGWYNFGFIIGISGVNITVKRNR